MRSWILTMCISALGLAFASPSAPAPLQPPPQPWSKKCTKSDAGGEGCDVTVSMRISPNSPCFVGCPEYCVKIKVVCPEGIPAGDPGEECESGENCEICCNDATTSVSVDCDGQTFTAEPKNGKNWGDVAYDCGSLKFQ